MGDPNNGPSDWGDWGQFDPFNGGDGAHFSLSAKYAGITDEATKKRMYEAMSPAQRNAFRAARTGKDSANDEIKFIQTLSRTPSPQTSGGAAMQDDASAPVDRSAFELPNYGMGLRHSVQGYHAAAAQRDVIAAQQAQARQQQMTLAQALQDRANGVGGPSPAELQMQRGQDASMAQAMAMQASAHGQNAGAAMRAAQMQRAGISRQAVSDSSLLRAQETAQAQNSLGQLVGGMRQQDLGQGAQNDSMTQYYLNMGFNLDQAKLAATQAYESARNQRYGLDRGLAVQSQAQQMQLLSAGMAAGGSALSSLTTISDERLKKDIKPADDKTYSFLDALNAAKYRYKDEKHGKGDQISVMAQELEKSELGRVMVEETDEGKRVNYGKGFGAMLAAQASLHKRLKALEGSNGDAA